MKKKIDNAIPFKFTNEAKDDEHVLTISGAIGKGGWFYEATDGNSVREALKDVKAKTIRIKLNSGGGDVFEGIEIMNYLKSLDANVIVEVTALAASAASIIAMGADEVVMMDGSTMMIHEASTLAYGTKGDIQKTMNALEAIDESLINVYANKTRLDKNTISNMLKAETWLTAEEAVAKGFANSIHKDSVEDEDEITNIMNIVRELQNELQEIKNQKNIIVEPAPVISEPAPIAASKRNVFTF